jgi:hypothetical protein
VWLGLTVWSGLAGLVGDSLASQLTCFGSA